MTRSWASSLHRTAARGPPTTTQPHRHPPSPFAVQPPATHSTQPHKTQAGDFPCKLWRLTPGRELLPSHSRSGTWHARARARATWHRCCAIARAAYACETGIRGRDCRVRLQIYEPLHALHHAVSSCAAPASLRTAGQSTRAPPTYARRCRRAEDSAASPETTGRRDQNGPHILRAVGAP